MISLLKKLIRLGLSFLIISFSWFIVLIIHEFGHTITAKILGDNTAYFKIVQFQNGKLTAIGSNQYNIHAFNWWQIIIVSLAGVIFTYILALTVLSFKNKTKHKLIKLTLNSIIFWGVFDLVFQEIQGLFADIVNRTQYCGGTTGICGNDFADVFWILYVKIASLLARHSISIDPFIIVGLIKMISVLIVVGLVQFIWIRWKIIKNNVKRVKGARIKY